MPPPPNSPRAPEGVPDSRGLNLLHADPSLRGLLELHLEPALCAHLLPHFERMGAMAGAELDELALAADKSPPVLRSNGDCQFIEKHQAYRQLEQVAFGEYGLAAMSHRGGVLGWPKPLPPIVKYALSYLYVQAEFGVCCPLSMTDSLTRTIRKFADPALVARYLPGLASQDMDTLVQGAMFMTEQNAGSDVGLISTSARKQDSEWRLFGDKWFCSNADAGLALVLARPEGAPAGTAGLSLFLLPRTLPDGSPNRYRIVRLKDKLGTRAMPSGEIALEGALAWLVGDPMQGFKQMTDMINMSRLSNGMRAAGMMRRALTEALFVARNRLAFGKRLIELPLMRRQLLKLMLPAEAARSVLFFAAKELESADAGDEQARRRVRLLTPLLKFRACRDARRVTGDAMEVRGGVGYTEEWSDPRLVRDAHLGSIWEGTSNVVALDVLRAIRREQCLEALLPVLDERISRAPRLLAGRLAASLDKAAEFAHETATSRSEAHARQAASGLYYACAGALLADEGARLGARGDARRLLIAFLAYVHRLAPRDPLRRVTTGYEAELADALLPETALAPAAVERILAHLA
ncbi:MAG: acyl-CoA dehydrogenase family protein [Betaproteobacteria bacterium]|nr:acyl-CoA dehydrogenase family protein [Betaproteobacteria bacterium]